MKEPRYRIFVPSEYAFLVRRGSEDAENWRELLGEAKQAVQDAYIADWQAYWTQVACVAAERKNTTTVEGVTWHVALVTPEMYYPCPPELAAKAIFASDREAVKSR